jgi:hypothetical protein
MDNVAVSVAFISAEASDDDTVAASIAGKMAGFTAALQYHMNEGVVGAASNDEEQMRVILGYNPGPFSISIDHQITETDTKNIDAETTGLNFVYRPAKGVELYAGARNAQATNGVVDENAFLFGARVKF